ncbi:MAG TPA: arylsulfatase [Planctomycetaceae bacterium]|nr:arylsulfatase [Planctomycetaceae bacterium]
MNHLFCNFILFLLTFCQISTAELLASHVKSKPPNIVLILCDNLGYGDIEPFGSKLHRTPHLNRLAESGRKFTHFYSASGVCTPSRAALMTGCYPQRVDMAITDGAVLRPVSPIGLNPNEWTMAEHLQKAGYATAAFGKWHLGDQPDYLPTNQGFDYFEGIPYSDDMTPREGQNWPPLPYMINNEVVDAPVDRDQMAKRLTISACEWIKDHQKEPFFVYIPKCMPGSTQAPFASEDFKGKSKNGPWGDSVEEIDWSLGEIVRTLSDLDLTDNTLIIWTSDNGAPRRTPVQGSNLPLSGWGYTTSEGGMRVPCIMSWPGTIPAGTVCDELSTMMDLYPTAAKLSQHPLDNTVPRDGHNILPLMLGQKNASSPYEAFYYYQMDQLQAVRSGKWKLYLPIESRSRTRNGSPQQQTLQLYDVVEDPAESKNLAESKPKVVDQLTQLTVKAKTELGDYQQPGSQVRPHAVRDVALPLLLTTPAP